MFNKQSPNKDRRIISLQALLIILFSLLFQGYLRAQQTLPDSIPFTAVDVEKWKQVAKIDMDHGVLVGTLANGEKVRMNRNHYLEFARKTGKVEEDEFTKTFTKVEIEPEYPGGTVAWTKYMLGNLHYPEAAAKSKLEGTVVVQFIVEKEGSVTDIESIAGPTSGGLREEAVNLVKKSGKWNPAIQNLRIVRAYKKQPVMFRLRDRTEP